jgi:hypothetical protein
MGMGSCKAAGRDGAPEEPMMILVATVEEEGFIWTSALGWVVTAKKKKRKISKRGTWISTKSFKETLGLVGISGRK